MSLHPLEFSSLVCTDVWFPDGNIVLIAGAAAFKVHKGQLGRHSDIFQDLFSVPQPQDEHLFDGCPWVELHDSPSDVLHLLRALYDGMYFQKSSADDFPIIAGVLRLSTKYMIEHLRKRCLVRLSSDWPETLAGWDEREKGASAGEGRYSPRDFYPHPLLVASLAIELGITELLPAAYYDLSRYGPRRIVCGTPLPLPLLPTSPNTDQTKPEDNPEEVETLVPQYEALRVILRGREEGQHYLSNFIEDELVSRPVSSSCDNRDVDTGRICRESYYYVMLNILRAVGGISHGRDADPLYTLTQVVDMLSRTDFTDGVKQCGLKICMPCKLDLTACVCKARREVWERIPVWFGVAPWKGSEISIVAKAEDGEMVVS